MRVTLVRHTSVDVPQGTCYGHTDVPVKTSFPEEAALVKSNDPYIEDWYKDYLHLPTPNGESFEMQYQRVSHFLDELRQQPYQNVAIFAHGGVLLCAKVYAGSVSFDKAFNGLVPYGGILQIEI